MKESYGGSLPTFIYCIFLDLEGNIKVGDFGLARLLSAGDEDRGGDGSVGVSFSADGDLSQSGISISGVSKDEHTSGVGTAMYSAPEQQEGQGKKGNILKFQTVITRRYIERADMFSVGVILLEMCRPPFPTGMERALTLRALRDNGTLPSDFPSEGPFANLRQVITWLVQYQPTNRPSAAELLISSLLPPRIDTDSMYLREITEALWRPNSEAAGTLFTGNSIFYMHLS
jgi:translation initiation factor 2-alpha kinase 4